tara:strand:- start:420 stop:551 length:132 start_codon:yes stop_codon:yes gene_type:complete
MITNNLISEHLIGWAFVFAMWEFLFGVPYIIEFIENAIKKKTR